MNNTNNLWHHQLFDELADGQAAYIANALQGPVHVGIHLAAYVLALEAHGALQMSERSSCSGTCPSLAACSSLESFTLGLRRDFSLRQISW